MTRNIIAIFLIIAAVFIFFSGTRPLWRETGVIKSEESGLNDFLQKIKETRALRDDLLAAYNTIPGRDLERLKKILPSSPEREVLIAQLEKMTESRGLNLKSIDLADISKEKDVQASPKPYRTMNLSLVLNGGYKDFLGFVKDLEENLRIVDFDEVSFGAATEKNTYEFSVKAKTYFLKQ